MATPMTYFPVLYEHTYRKIPFHQVASTEFTESVTYSIYVNLVLKNSKNVNY